MDIIEISPQGRRWAIRHKGAFLGFAASEQEANGVVRLMGQDFSATPTWPAKSLATTGSQVRDASRPAHAPGLPEGSHPRTTPTRDQESSDGSGMSTAASGRRSIPS